MASELFSMDIPYLVESLFEFSPQADETQEKDKENQEEEEIYSNRKEKEGEEGQSE